jgi:LmbE family N-acetylglucosaminyl deacetylase
VTHDPDAVARPGPVLAIFAHPDDAEIAAGGTLARWADAGRHVHLLVLTNGDRGSADPALDRAALAATRLAETRAGADVLGLSSAQVLGVPDGDLQNTEPVREAVVRRIREVRAETVVSMDPTAWFLENRYYNHSDHRRAGEIALDAVFPGAGNPHYFAHHLREGLPITEVHDVWLAWTTEPNHDEDITGFFGRKVEALARHESQLVEGIRFFEEFMAADATTAGARIGVEHAEAFRVLDLS